MAKEAPITSFDGDYRFLSNFAASEVVLDGLKYPTVEHAYQAAKTMSLASRLVIRAAGTAGMAKSLGRRVAIRDGWDNVKIDVMRDLLRQKFERKVYQDALFATGEAELIEGNTWGDTFWGVCRGLGENHLGKLLMDIRSGYLLLAMASIYPGDPTGALTQDACKLLGVPYEPPEVIITRD